jgi:imidazolonepropionase-like amidohydrolase
MASAWVRPAFGVILSALVAACSDSGSSGGADSAGPPVPPPESGDPGGSAPDMLPALLDSSTPVAFHGVTVVPMDGPTLMPAYTVVVRDRRIADIGPVQDVTVPDDAVVIEGEGRYLMPGLADMHVHLVRQENFTLLLANGVTTVRNMWGSPLAVLDWRDEIARGELLGPRIYSASRGLDGSPPVWPTTIVVEDAAAARLAVEQEAAMGFDFIKVYNSLNGDAYDAIVERAGQLDIPVIGHVPRAVGVEHVLDRGQATIEHLSQYPVQLEGDAFQAFVNRHAVAGTWACPTMIVRISFVNPTDAARLESRPEMRYVHPADRANWSPVAGAAPMSVQREASRQRGRMIRALKDSGTGILLGTDSWISYVIHGFSIHDELRLLVEDAQFTLYEALRAGTADAARAVGAEDEWGTIAPGLAADLLLLDANPLDDLANLRRRSGVMAGGTWFSEAELRRRLEALAERYGSVEFSGP